MKYLAVLISNIFVSLPSALLVFAYAHFGTFENSASLGIAMACVAPLTLLFSMQHGIAIIGGVVTAQDAIALRVKLSPLYLFLAATMSVVWNEWLILMMALYRFGDILYEPSFFERMRVGDGRGLLLGSCARLVAFMLGLILGSVLGMGLVPLLASLAIVNLAMSAWSADPQWRPRIRRASLTIRDISMGVAACLASLSANVPRYFLTEAPRSDLAAYSNMLTLVLAGTLMFISFNNLFYSRAVRSGPRAVVVFLVRSAAAGLLAIVFAWIFVIDNYAVAKNAIQLSLGVKYVSYAHLLPLFWILYCFLYLQSVANSALIYWKKGHQIMLANLLLVLLLIAGFLFARGGTSALLALVVVLVAMSAFLLTMGGLVFWCARRAGGFSRSRPA